MNKLILLLILTFLTGNVTAQMDFQDSSAQVITYWNLGEKYSYSVHLQTSKYNDTDTLEHENITYNVDVTVIDSTANSYIVEWHYKDYKTDTEDPIVQKFSTIAEDIAVQIEIDDMGVIRGVLNWEEVREFMTNAINKLKVEIEVYKEMEGIFDELTTLYSSKEAIESTCIEDAHQYHNFHGGKYMKNEDVTGSVLTPNLYYPDQPFDTDVTIILEDLDKENNQFVIRSIQTINSEQLTETTYNYLDAMMKKMGQEFIPRDEFNDLSNVVESVSRIHNTGWVLESVQWKEVVSEGITKMEMRNIFMN